MSVGKGGTQKLRFTFTSLQGVGDPAAPCAFHALSQQAVANPNMDKTPIFVVTFPTF